MFLFFLRGRFEFSFDNKLFFYFRKDILMSFFDYFNISFEKELIGFLKMEVGVRIKGKMILL